MTKNSGSYKIAYIDYLYFVLFSVISLMIMLLAMAMQKIAEGNITSKAEFIIQIQWKDYSKNDIDLWVSDPQKNIMFYSNKNVGFLNLERDDKSGADDTVVLDDGEIRESARREEIATIRGIIPGKYTVNVVAFSAINPEPEQVKVIVRKLNPYEEIYSNTIVLEKRTDEKTAVTFELDDKGKVISKDTTTQISLTTLAGRKT